MRWATEQGFPRWRAEGAAYRGWVKVKNGDVVEGISPLRRGSIGVLLSMAYEIAGQIEEALTLMDKALQAVDKTGVRWGLAELHRLKGQLLLRQGHSEAAKELYRKTLTIAEEQGAKLGELRAAASLAPLRHDQGRHAVARNLLAPIYGWFTEGFDSDDVKAAKALLDELG